MPPKSSPTVINHGRYTIRAMRMGDTCKARAFLKDARQGSGDVGEADADSIDAAIKAVRNKLDERDRAMRQGRRRDDYMKFDVPTADEYAIALRIVSLGEAQRRMLFAHAKAGDEGMNATELANAGGWPDFSSGNLHYGKAGRLMAESLGIRIPLYTARDDENPTAVLAFWRPTPEDPHSIGRWVMYPELR